MSATDDEDDAGIMASVEDDEDDTGIIASAEDDEDVSTAGWLVVAVLQPASNNAEAAAANTGRSTRLFLARVTRVVMKREEGN